MSSSAEDQGHRLTWLAVILTFLLHIPGLFIGQLVALIYGYFLGALLEWNIFDWLSQGWFSKIALTYFPALLAGGIGGGFGIYVTSKILKKANYEIVMYAASAIVITLTIPALMFNLARYGINLDALAIASNSLGIVLGLYGGYTGIKEEQAGTV